MDHAKTTFHLLNSTTCFAVSPQLTDPLLQAAAILTGIGSACFGAAGLLRESRAYLDHPRVIAVLDWLTKKSR